MAVRLTNRGESVMDRPTEGGNMTNDGGTVPNTSLIVPEPPPTQNGYPAVWYLVVLDMWARDKFGVDKYGTHLQPFNGRDALKDAYQEALDLCVYLRQAIFERDGR